MGLALVVDQQTQLPLAHALYQAARSDMQTFAEFLKPLRQRLRDLNQFTLVFDAGASSKQNLEGMEHYVTAVRPCNHRALLSEVAEQLFAVPLSNGALIRAWRSQRIIAGTSSDWQEYQRLVTHHFGLRVLITDRAEWSTAQIIEA